MVDKMSLSVRKKCLPRLPMFDKKIEMRRNKGEKESKNNLRKFVTNDSTVKKKLIAKLKLIMREKNVTTREINIESSIQTAI